jgi:hypothetical protein
VPPCMPLTIPLQGRLPLSFGRVGLRNSVTGSVGNRVRVSGKQEETMKLSVVVPATGHKFFRLFVWKEVSIEGI